jgi:hypothetical protein
MGLLRASCALNTCTFAALCLFVCCSDQADVAARLAAEGQLLAMGFDLYQAGQALDQTKGVVER